MNRVLSHFAGVAQLVEHHLAKVAVESSNLFARSTFRFKQGRRSFFCGQFCVLVTGRGFQLVLMLRLVRFLFVGIVNGRSPFVVLTNYDWLFAGVWESPITLTCFGAFAEKNIATS